MPKNMSVAAAYPAAAWPKWSLIFPSFWLRKRVGYHGLFWGLLLLFYTFYIGYLVGNYQFSLYSFAIRLPVMVLFCYLNIYLLLPRLLLRGHYVQYIGALGATMLVAAILTQALFDLLINIRYCPRSFEAKWMMNTSNTLEKFVLLFTTTGLTTGIKLAKDWINYQQKVKRIEQQNLRNELTFLKSQLQPHFFFNTLNNLYSLTLQKSDEAPETVVKLSDMMSYMLYECDVPTIPLSKEIMHMRTYLDLEMLRFGQRLKLDFQVDGDVQPCSIPPLLLLPFIENSFKHGIANQVRKAKIEMRLTVAESQIRFEITNPRLDQRRPERAGQGLGLKNVRRRLELLYGSAYELTIEESDTLFHVKLLIPCA